MSGLVVTRVGWARQENGIQKEHITVSGYVLFLKLEGRSQMFILLLCFLSSYDILILYMLSSYHIIYIIFIKT